MTVAPTGRVLVLQRPNGLWESPGGHVDPGESYEQAAVREFFEETGYAGDGLRVSRDALVADHDTVRYYSYLALVDNEFRPTHPEHVDARWRRPDRLPTPMHPGAAIAIGFWCGES